MASAGLAGCCSRGSASAGQRSCVIGFADELIWDFFFGT